MQSHTHTIAYRSKVDIRLEKKLLESNFTKQAKIIFKSFIIQYVYQNLFLSMHRSDPTPSNSNCGGAEFCNFPGDFTRLIS